jgi:hypothetical protein
MIQPNFGYFDISGGRLVISFYYPDETGATKREELTVLKNHIEVTELCIKLNAMLPLMAQASARFEKGA